MLLGEDQRSIDKNVAAIVSECKKRAPDLNLLADKLKRTVAYSQKMCLEKTTSEILQSFPTLRMFSLVSCNYSTSYYLHVTVTL